MMNNNPLRRGSISFFRRGRWKTPLIPALSQSRNDAVKNHEWTLIHTNFRSVPRLHRGSSGALFSESTEGIRGVHPDRLSISVHQCPFVVELVDAHLTVAVSGGCPAGLAKCISFVVFVCFCECQLRSAHFPCSLPGVCDTWCVLLTYRSSWSGAVVLRSEPVQPAGGI